MGYEIMNWVMMQLSDSAFPTGGFAHSGGFEAAFQLGEIQGPEGFENFLTQALWQMGYASLPLASAGYMALDQFSLQLQQGAQHGVQYGSPKSLKDLDELADIFLNGHVANRASRVQGRTFLSACLRSFGTETLISLSTQIHQEALHLHYAPVFGAALRTLGIERESMQRLFLHTSLRGIISSAVRLGSIGSYQAQRIQWRFSSKLDEVLLRCGELQVSDIAQTSPLLDLFQSTQDRLYSKLFQS